MFTDENRNILIYVTVKFPWAPDSIEKRIALSPHTFEAFRPLSPDRDLYPEFGQARARDQAIIQDRERSKLAQMVGGLLTAAIFEAVQSRDPIHGYSPEQWAEINHPRDFIPIPTPTTEGISEPSTSPESKL